MINIHLAALRTPAIKRVMHGGVYAALQLPTSTRSRSRQSYEPYLPSPSEQAYG
jgi:hypothetical protein